MKWLKQLFCKHKASQVVYVVGHKNNPEKYDIVKVECVKCQKPMVAFFKGTF